MSGKRFETADDLVNKGNSFFVDEQFDEALEAYTAAIDLEEDHAEAYLKRSAAHYSLKNFTGTCLIDTNSRQNDADKQIEARRRSISVPRTFLDAIWTNSLLFGSSLNRIHRRRL
jgi:tetratricopeptide (TPR) repeat protein